MADAPNTSAKPIRRPSRILFVLMVILTAIVLVLNTLFFTVAKPYHGLLNAVTIGAPTGADIEQAAQSTKDVVERVEEGGIILLKDDNDALPLTTTQASLLGSTYNQFSYGGTGSGSGDVTKNVSFLDGLANAGLELNPELVEFYAENALEPQDMGLVGTDFNLYELPLDSYPAETLAAAESYSDTALVVLTRKGGEGADLPTTMADYDGSETSRHYLELTPNEEDLLAYAEGAYENVVVILNSPNAMELGFLESDAIDAAIWVGTPGATGCNAIGRVLTGEVNPSGRTVDTFPYEVESAPSYYNFGGHDYTNITYGAQTLAAGTGDAEAAGNYHWVDYVEGIYVGYRYYETAAADGYIDYDATVQYPFGYGLSYTTFEQTLDSVQQAGDSVTVRAAVKNTGKVAGRDVVQVYAKAPYTAGGIEKSEVVLVTYGKTGELAPGASETVELTFALEDLASYDYAGVKAEAGAYVLEAGDYEIRLQNNSHDLIGSETITVAADVIYDDAHDGARASDDETAVNRFDDATYGDNLTYLSRADWEGTFPTMAEHDREATAEQIVVIEGRELEDGEGDDIVTAKHGLKLADMAGLDYDDPKWDELVEQVSVQEMTDLVANGGWQTIAIASVDKPYLTELDGPNGVNNILAGWTGTQMVGQSVLGYTWDADLAEEFGHNFGQEAKALNVAGLYAPACNIHRSPFSGRNYEYVSEDPVLTGMTVAREAAGIEDEGVYCYTKHFALNDQETNRDNGGLVTWANEQAIREIYLKPFEMAVKIGGTQGIMSSFNRIGAVPTAESYPLLTEVLRGEWGFRGHVITDCIMAATTCDTNKALRAGNDLFLTYGILAGLDQRTTNTVAGHHALRAATKNILYTQANSAALQTARKGTSVLLIGLGVIDAAVIALIVLYYVRRHRKMGKWRAQQAGQTA